MKLSLIFIIAFLNSGWLFGFQEDAWEFYPPDYSEIEKRIAESHTPFYYPKLVERFNSADTTLTIDQIRHLYYGYQFQKTYSPYASSDYKDSIQQVFKQKNDLSESDYLKVLRYSDSVLYQNPFDFRMMNYQLFALKALKKQVDFDKRFYQANALLDAILSTGDGLSKETAIWVIFVSNEYDLINLLGLQYAGEQQLIDTYDYLKVAQNDVSAEGLYFEISASLNKLGRMLKD